MSLELASVLAGMMIVLPAQRWEMFGEMPAGELAALLKEWAEIGRASCRERVCT